MSDKFIRQLHNYELCKDCYYWECKTTPHNFDPKKDVKTGKCHRYPEITEHHSTHWCGEFRKDEK